MNRTPIMTAAISECGLIPFQPVRGELGLQRRLGLTLTSDWAPFTLPAEADDPKEPVRSSGQPQRLENQAHP